MRKVEIFDTTLKLQSIDTARALSFKEKLELARCLDKMQVDAVEFGAVENERTDSLLIKTACPLISYSTVCVDAGNSPEQAALAAASLKQARKARITVNLPVSPVQMEYVCHKKPAAMLEYIEAMVKAAGAVGEVEFCAQDATRAEKEFLVKAIAVAKNAGATHITLCDTEGLMLPEEVYVFVKDITESANAEVMWGFEAKDTVKMAQANCVSAIKAGVGYIKTAVYKDSLSTETFANMLRSKGMQIGMECGVNFTQIERLCTQIKWIINGEKAQGQAMEKSADEGVRLTRGDDITAVINEVKRLGYDLSEEDNAKVYEAFCALSDKKDVGVTELEAIVASTALQVPPTYKVKSYVINSGNIIKATANITLEKQGEEIFGLCAGDGPIDSAFRAIEQIIGEHFELDDFQIQSITRGREAMGSALVRLRYNGKLYSGNGVSTDIIGASIRAYVNALNKIVYEESVK